ncbi:MAG: hypothetical protein ABIQ89_02225 [Candidatus Saccharimonadales bacterium]
MNASSEILRVSSAKDWQTGVEAVHHNELLGCITTAFTAEEVDLESAYYYDRRSVAPSIVPAAAMELAVAAINSSVSKPFQVNIDKPMDRIAVFRAESGLHVDGSRGLRLASLVMGINLLGKSQAYLMRLPTFSHREIQEILDNYADENGDEDIGAITADSTSIIIDAGDILAYSAGGNQLAGRYPVAHRFEPLTMPRLSVSVANFSFSNRLGRTRAHLGNVFDAAQGWPSRFPPVPIATKGVISTLDS